MSAYGIVLLVALSVFGPVGLVDAAPGVDTSQLRTTTSLAQDWRFVQDDTLTDDAALASTGADWQTVNLPHTLECS